MRRIEVESAPPHRHCEERSDEHGAAAYFRLPE
jgi:hypothetical protein